jgi:hypothetical protein
MFMHAGLRPLWPMMAFVPWLILGVGLLLHAAAQRLRQPLALRSRSSQLSVIAVLGLGLLAAARVVMADSPAPESRPCEVGTAQEAASLADRLYAKGEYQRAGECYRAAGDLVHANLAFLQAAGPAGEDTARELKAQKDAAKALFASVGQAFRKSH